MSGHPPQTRTAPREAARTLRRLSGVSAVLAIGLGVTVPCLGAAEAGKPLKVGNHVPPLHFGSTTGETVSLDWSVGGPAATLLFFFEPGSADALREMTFVDVLFRSAADLGLAAYAVEGSGLGPAEIDEGMARYRRLFPEPPFPLAADPDYRLGALFGIGRLPTTLLIESHGVVLGRNEGFSDLDVVEITGKVERLLGVGRGAFASVLRESGIDEASEKNLLRTLGEMKQAAAAPADTSRSLAVNDKVFAFEFTDLAGTTRSWQPGAGAGKVTILFFWGALCLPCIEEMAYLQEVHAAAGPPGLDVLAVEAGGLSPERVAVVMKRYERFHPPPSYSVVPDPDGRLAALFGVGDKVPQTFVIDREGTVVFHTGEFVQDGLSRGIETALGLDPGSLQRTGAGDPGAAPTGAVPPSLRREEGENEVFRSNLVLGDTYYNAWEFGKALPHYLRCLAIVPGDVALRERVAEIYERLGDLEKALAQWREILRIDPSNSKAIGIIEERGGM